LCYLLLFVVLAHAVIAVGTDVGDGVGCSLWTHLPANRVGEGTV
jgi:hypothetical protein